MEEACDPATFSSQPVVRSHRGVCLLAHYRDTTRFEKCQCAWRDPEPTLAAAAEDHDIGLVFQELSDVCGENSRPVIGPGFGPVPRSPAARPQFDVAEPAEPLYLDVPPTVIDHRGRQLAHILRLVGGSYP